MENKIIQGSEEWKAVRQSKIGASEVFTLVHHYCKKDLEALGLDLPKELPFRTIQELFLKIKFGAQLTEIDPVFAQFGNGMEPYVAYRLSQELPQLEIERSKEFLLNEELHPLAACSPDGYVETIGEAILEDFDKKKEINSLWGRGALELKTANFFAGFSASQGAKLQYIFQNQFQQMVMGLKWGVIAVLMPKQSKFDELFFKGRMYELACSEEFEIVDEHYDLHHYVYPALPAFQAMIGKALALFQTDLDLYDLDQSRFPRNSEDSAGLQREKKMWGEIWPEHFGTLKVEAGSDLDDLIGKRVIAAGDEFVAKTSKENYTNQLLQRTGKYVEVIGSTHKMKFAKDGSVRFSKVKEEKA